MKKKFSMLMGLSLSLLALSGCNPFQVGERDLEVVLKVEDQIFFHDTVNIFKNAVIPALDDSYLPDDEHTFMGWALGDYLYGSSPESQLIEPEGLLRYQDIKDYAVNNTVTLNAYFVSNALIPEPYFVLGWYARTTTSGLDDKIMETFTGGLMTYLAAQGATEQDLATVTVRPYAGDVATIGAAINKDGDVDVLLGVGKNIGSTGGVSFIERKDELPMGGKSRSIARLSDKEIAIKVYQWIQTDEALNLLK